MIVFKATNTTISKNLQDLTGKNLYLLKLRVNL